MSVKVSTIVPSHNYGAFIGDALRSVEAQTFGDWECIVVDDASTDDTAAQVEAFVQRDPRFRYLRLSRNAGVSVARNTGLQVATGSYIQFLDADDAIAPRKLELQVEVLDREADVDLVYSDYIRFTDRPDWSAPGAYRPDERLSGSGDRVMARLLRSNIFRIHTLLFRAQVLRDVGVFRDAFSHVEDWDLWLRVVAHGCRFRFLDDPRALSAVRSNPHSLSSDKPAMRRHYLPVLQHVWAHGRLSFRNALGLILRYDLFLLDRLLLRKGEVIVLKDRRIPFLVVVTLTSLVVLPIWPFYKLWRAVF